MEKTILYLHGLESSQGGRKVEYLSSIGYVHAPVLNYKENSQELFDDLLIQVKKLKPDIIIGSSMGGYFAELLASHVETKVILFNPGTILKMNPKSPLHINTPNGEFKLDGVVVLGIEDDIVDPVDSGGYYDANHENVEIVFENIGHQTPIEVFEKYVEKVI